MERADCRTRSYRDHLHSRGLEEIEGAIGGLVDLRHREAGEREDLGGP